MAALSFFVRTMLITAVAVLILQIRPGQGAGTLEDQMMEFLTSSAVVKPVNSTASGAVVFIRNMWSKVTSSINTNFTQALREENQPGSRQMKFNFQRSEQAVKKKAEEVGEAAQGAYEEARDPDSPLRKDTRSIIERFKQSAENVGKKVRGQFSEATMTADGRVDETHVPGDEE